MPRARVWDALIARTHSLGLFFEDYPELADLDLPEWSHLSRASATRFTRFYVSRLLRDVAWLQRR